jgi:NAD(P)-dependent dehydrogenase (short-subunit alcohol dehydrogenase family)
MGRLDGKIAVITGACSGIGLGTVELFVEEGAHVLAADIQDAAGAALEARFPGKVRYQHCDVTSESDIAATMQAAKDSFGGLDILFNNAGAGGSPLIIEEMTGEAWDFSFNLLLRSVALGMRYATPLMAERGGGAIVNTASVAGLEAGRGPIAYSVAKAGVIHLSKVGAAQLSRHNIRVNAICPGLILTNIFTASQAVPDGLKDQVKAEMRQSAPNTQPIKKAGEPRDIAEACLFFASDAGAFVTGTHILVDGGLLVGPRQSWDPMMQAERAREIESRRAAFEAKQKE